MRATNEATYIVTGNMAGNLTGGTIRIDQIYGVSYAAKWSGNPTGTIEVQGSNSGTTGEWETVSSQAAGGAPGFKLFNLDAIHYKFSRLIFVQTGGAGSLDVHFHAKGS